RAGDSRRHAVGGRPARGEHRRDAQPDRLVLDAAGRGARQVNTTATLAVSTALLGMLVLARLRRPLPRHVASERAGVTSGRRLRRSRLTAMVVRPVIAIATVVALTSAVVAGPLFAIVLAGCAGVGHLARRRAARRRVQREIEASVPDAVELL